MGFRVELSCKGREFKICICILTDQKKERQVEMKVACER